VSGGLWLHDLQSPSTTICSEAYSLCSMSAPLFLLNHSVRVFAWGCILSRREEQPFDREVLYVWIGRVALTVLGGS
jgi:hypothetical protein